MENRSGLIVQGDLTQADGHAERQAALALVHRHSPGSTRRRTLGADKGYDSADFVADLRHACVTPARRARGPLFRHRRQDRPSRGLPPLAALPQEDRPRRDNDPPDRCLVLLTFGWAKTVGGMVQTVYRGFERARFTLTMAACNLARFPKLLAA